jgi:DNA-binding HxlR family transcriptional regulator
VITRQLCGQFHRAIELIGRRWNGAIVFVLLPGRARFCELRNAIPEITDRMLTERLQELEREGIVIRTVIPDTPVRVEYALTNKGKSLADTIQTITAWGAKWLPKASGHADERTTAASAGRRSRSRASEARSDAKTPFVGAPRSRPA